MKIYKILFFIEILATVLALSGCATYLPAPVEEARVQTATPGALANLPQATASSKRPGAPAESATAIKRAETQATAVTRSEAPTARSPEMLFAALAAAGFDYKRGGKSMASGFDCSGLVAHVFLQAYDVKLPHNAAAQSAQGSPIERAALEPGDLVFFNTERRPYSHVGIYLGDELFIHAPKPGAVVRTENMKLGYWNKRYDGARRIVE